MDRGGGYPMYVLYGTRKATRLYDYFMNCKTEGCLQYPPETLCGTCKKVIQELKEIKEKQQRHDRKRKQ